MSKKLLVVVCALLASVMSTAAMADVLIAASPSSGQAWAQDVIDQIKATGKVEGNVEWFDTSTGTPTLDQLREYDAVLTFTDRGSQNPDLLGDNLADYVDEGGGVVQAVFSWHTSIPLRGRWASGGYSPLTYASQAQGTRLTLDERHLPNHPVLDDVDSFDGGTASYHNTVEYANGAIEIADWSNGRPLVAEMPGKDTPIIGLNFYPPSSDARGDFWESGSDGEHLLANALSYVSGGGGCGDKAKLKASCKQGGTKVKGKIKKAEPNKPIKWAIDGGQERQGQTNDKGKAKNTWKKQEEGAHGVTVCGLEKECTP